jgi:integrase
MSLFKRCTCEGWRCGHSWWYRFRLNRRNYRATTETHLKQQAADVEARERSRILEGRHGIRRQPDIRFSEFAAYWLDASKSDKTESSDKRDREIVKVLNRWFGTALLHEVTALRIGSFKRERLAGTWKAHGQKSAPKPIQPGTVNRELDALKALLAWAVKEKKLIASPAAEVAHLKTRNRRLRILSAAEQRALLAACQGPRQRKLAVLLELLLITGGRLGELLGLEWADVSDEGIGLLNTKNGKVRLIEMTPRMQALFASLPRTSGWVFTSPRTGRRYRNIDKVFARALERATITTGDVTPHTLRHTAISRMVSAGIDDYTIMELVGHLTKAMLARYTHPVTQRKQAALESFDRLVTFAPTVLTGEHKLSTRDEDVAMTDPEVAEMLKELVDGRRLELPTSALRTRRSPS